MTSELLPCPFCGGPGRIHECSIKVDARKKLVYHACCENCECELTHFRTKAEAVAAWNNRALNSVSMNEFISELRALFYARLTVDSEHHDRRRKDFNQALFFPLEDPDFAGHSMWTGLDLSMVLQAFDGATRDFSNN